MPFKNIRTSHDTYVDDDLENTNFGSSVELLVGRRKSDAKFRAFFKFNIVAGETSWNDIPVGATITEAYFYIYSTAARDEGIGTSVKHSATPIAGAWDHSTVTWDNQPLIFSIAAGTQSITFGTWNKIDVKSFALEAFSDTAVRDKGLALIAFDPLAKPTVVHYESRNTATGRVPYMQIFYEATVPSIASAVTNTEKTGTLVSGGSATKAPVEVHRSAAATSGFVKAGNATGIASWTFTDTEKAPPPASPIPVIVPSGNAFDISWDPANQPSITRYFKARKVLSDGTTSDFTGTVQNTFTPGITKYILQRRTIGAVSPTWTTVYEGTGLSYTDTGVEANKTYEYQVIAENTQGERSDGTSSGEESVGRPPSPVLNAVTLTSDWKFRLTGSINAPERMKVFTSPNGSLYELFEEFAAGGINTFTRDVLITAPPPPPPVFEPTIKTPESIELRWTQAANPTLTRFFRVSQIVNSVESSQSVTQRRDLSLPVNLFIVDRRRVGSNEPFTEVYRGTELGYTDTNFSPGFTYEYRLKSRNAQQTLSQDVYKQEEAPLPQAPINVVAYNVVGQEGYQKVRVAGAGLNNAPEVRIERSVDNGVTWTFVGNATLSGTKTGEEFFFDDVPPVVSPLRVEWSPYSYVDSSGITLRWLEPTNPTSNYRYRARRVVNGVSGNPSSTVLGSITPKITSYTLERRNVTTDSVFQQIFALMDLREYKDVLDDSPSAPTAVKSESRYEYRVKAHNARGLESPTASPLAFQTFDIPPEAPQIDPPKPVVTGGFPVGTVNVAAGDAIMRVGWNYSAPDNSPQDAYELSVNYPVGGLRSSISPGEVENNSKYTISAVDVGTSGDDIRVQILNSNVADAPLTIDVSGLDITINLANGPTQGDISSTASDVVEAINNDPDASQLVTASLYPGSDGTGLAGTILSYTNLTGGRNPDTYVTRWWDGSSWGVDGQVIKVDSSLSLVEVSTALAAGEAFVPGPQYKFSVKAYSQAGSISDAHTWFFTVTIFAKGYFDLERKVSRIQRNTFDLERRVRGTLSGAYKISLEVAWAVEPQLPYEVRPEGLEGKGTAWPHVIFDNNMRPEPNGEVDFIKDGVTKTFQADERGRLVLRLPHDLAPGIYRMRERGPSMAPRTTDNFPVVDPSTIYDHGPRHSASGEDPVYGIKDEQISDDANISASKMLGADSLAEITDKFGGDIIGGLEEHVSAGHGNYWISGFETSFDTDTSILSIATGVCWANGRLWEPTEVHVVLSEGSVYKAYVYMGEIFVEIGNSYPVDSCPLYELEVNGGVLSETDERLVHPSSSPLSDVLPVFWGPRTAAEVDYRGVTLGSFFSQMESDILALTEENARKETEFEQEKNRIATEIARESSARDRASEAVLNASHAVSLKQIYSLHEGRVVPPLYHVSAFDQEVYSPLTTLAIQPSNKRAILPANWSRSAMYTLRTARIPVAPSHYLDFTLIYEETGGVFEVLGSLNTVGFYAPRVLQHVRTISATSPYTPSKQWKISTYRARFPNWGDEGVVEVRCYGGTVNEGVILRGYFLHAA